MVEALDGDFLPRLKILDLRTTEGVDVADSVGAAIPGGVVGRDGCWIRVEAKEGS